MPYRTLRRSRLLLAEANNFQRNVKRRFFEVDDDFHGFEPGFRDTIQSEVGLFELDGLSVFVRPLVRARVEEAGLRVAQEHLHMVATNYA